MSTSENSYFIKNLAWKSLTLQVLVLRFSRSVNPKRATADNLWARSTAAHRFLTWLLLDIERGGDQMSGVKLDPLQVLNEDWLLLTSSSGGLHPISHKTHVVFSLSLPLSLCLSVSRPPCFFLVWTTASYLWMMWMCGRWHTAKPWRLSRRQVLSSASTFSAGNPRRRKSPNSNSSKGLKVCGSMDRCTRLQHFSVGSRIFFSFIRSRALWI